MGCIESQINVPNMHSQIPPPPVAFKNNLSLNSSNVGQKSKIINADMYNFSDLDNRPETLVLTTKPKYLESLMFQIPKFICLHKQNKNLKDKIKIIEKGIDEPIIQFSSIQKIIKQFSNDQLKYVILICDEIIVEQASHKLSQFDFLKGIICWCDDKLNSNQAKLLSLGEKIKLISDKAEEVTNFIKKNKSLYYKNKEHFNFIQVSQSNSGSSTFFRTISLMFIIPCNRKALIEQILELARLMWGHQANYITQFEQKMLNVNTLQSKDAIFWYTRETFLYKLVNILLRSTRSPCEMFILQPYFKDLYLAILNLYKEQIKNQTEQELIFYKGGILSEKQFELIKRSKGKIIQNLTFMSTSSRKQVAKRFMVNCLFTIHVKTKNDPDKCYAKIKEFSSIPDQQQTLFNPLNSFKVLEVFQTSENIYQIKLIHGQIPLLFNKDENILTQYEYNVKKQIQFQFEESKRALFGYLLERDFLFQNVSQLYWEKYMSLILANKSFEQLSMTNSSPITPIKIKPELAFEMINMEALALIKLSHFFEINGNYQKALKLSTSAMQKLKPENLYISQKLYCLNSMARILSYSQKAKQALNILKTCLSTLQKLETKLDKKYFSQILRSKCVTWNHLAMAYNKLKQPHQAIKIIQNCLNVDNNFDQNQLGSLYCNLSQAYIEKQDFPKAAYYSEKGLEIDSRIFGKNHPSYAISLLNYSFIQAKLKNIPYAIQLFQMCAKIFKQNYKQNHPIYLKTISLLASSYFQQGNFNQMIKLLDDTKQIRQRYQLYNEDMVFNEGVANLKIFHVSDMVSKQILSVKIKKIFFLFLKRRSSDLLLPRAMKILSNIYIFERKYWISSELLQKYFQYHVPDTERQILSNCYLLALCYVETCQYQKAINFIQGKLGKFQRAYISQEIMNYVFLLQDLLQKAIYLNKFLNFDKLEQQIILRSKQDLIEEIQQLRKIIKPKQSNL